MGLVMLYYQAIGQPLDETNYDEKIRVACVGNSVTYGHGLDDPNTNNYPAVLQGLLGEKYEVANFGRSGATLLKKGHNPYWLTDEYKNALDFKPHVVVIHLGLNDTDPRNWPNYRDDFIKDYTELIDHFLSVDVHPRPKVWICRMTPIFSGHRRFKAGTRDWFWQIQNSINLIAQNNDVGFIDLHTPLYSRPDLFPDNLHPTKEGAQIIATEVYQHLTGDFGGLQMPNVFSDHMVLQREMNIPVWGTANYNERISTQLGDITLNTKSDAYGNWKLEFPPMQAGGPYNLKVSADDKSIIFEDILIGEVWLCSGQSNMAFELKHSAKAAEEIPKADLPDIRLLNMKTIAWGGNVSWSEEVLKEINKLQFFNGSWQKCTPETASEFSAIAYHFGKTLNEDLNVPIGLIHNAKGGSPTESWIDRFTLEFHPQLVDLLDDWSTNEMIDKWCQGRGAINIKNAKNSMQRHPFEPAYLNEAGIMSLTQFPIKGVIWYQGESNANNVELHETLFPTLVKSWRKAWGYDFPFYYVQLSSLNRPSWPHFRDSQRRLADKIPNSTMVVSSDLGHPSDVHPKHKKQIGERLALCAEVKTYGIDIEYSGPEVQGIDYSDGKASVYFTHAEGLNSGKEDILIGFELAGEDKIFEEATAKIEGEKVILVSDHVKDPRYVRYAWKPYTEANLFNSSALPASTFTTEFQIENNKTKYEKD